MSKPTLGQAQHLLTIISQKGVTSESLTALFESGVLSDVLDADLSRVDREAFRATLGLGRIVPDTFRFTVVAGQSLEAMTTAGRYDWVNSNITKELFPIADHDCGDFEGRYFHFGRKISSEEAVQRIEKEDPNNPWSRSRLPQQLSFGAKFPEEQRKFPIVALGSVAEVEGGRRVPYLDGSGSHRGLRLYGWGGDWLPAVRFLAVRRILGS